MKLFDLMLFVFTIALQEHKEKGERIGISVCGIVELGENKNEGCNFASLVELKKLLSNDLKFYQT